MSCSPDLFKAAFRHHPSGVAVITIDSSTGPVALTASSVFSVSAEPPMLVFSVSKTASASAPLHVAETLVVHLIATPQLELAKLCAKHGADRFAGDVWTWRRYDSGEPFFEAPAVRLRCRIAQRVEAGASTLIVGEVLDVAISDDADVLAPLVYHDRAWHRLDDGSVL
jgi:flavin reductase (DIM6/NTAB) family NADH-FMN oxidoreductase RutF